MDAEPVKPIYRHLALIVFLMLTSLTVAGFFVARTATENSERQLVHERGAEVGGLVTSSTNSLKATLGLLNETYSVRRVADAGYKAGLRSLTNRGTTTVGVAEVVGSKVLVRSVEGPAFGDGAQLTAERAALARRAVHANDVVTAIIKDASSGRTKLVLALGRANGVVVFEESTIDPSRAIPSAPGSPYHELNVSLYQSATSNRDHLVFTTTPKQSLSGMRDERTLTVGADRWLLVTSAKEWLAGSLAQAVAWIILVGGIAAALAVAGIVALVSRRRAYAFALVDERTAELRASLADLQSARDAADAANRSKSAFLSRMSHELRTPLNAVLGFAQVLDLEGINDDQQEAVDQILRGGKHLLGLINEVLDISRIESGDLALSPEAVLVSDVVSESVDLIRPLAEQRSIHLDGERRACVDTHVFADRQRLKQILLNLLSNAVKYNRQRGTVTISCEHPEPTRLRIKIADTGPGITTEQRGRLFVPFERLGAERTNVEGTGIGLALSLRLAEAMGGTIDFESAPGEGSTFWVELPLVEGPVERYERLQPDDAPTERTKTDERRQTVLYIEDNLANLKLVQRVIAHRTDVDIIPAMQGGLGLDLAREHQPALVLLDMHLPDISGDRVLQQLREDPATTAIPVVIVSADATLGQQQRLVSAGASAYLTKPYEVQELVRIIDEALTQAKGSTPRGEADTER